MNTKYFFISTIISLAFLIGCGGQYDDDYQSKMDEYAQKMSLTDMSPINIVEYNTDKGNTVVLLGDSRVGDLNQNKPPKPEHNHVIGNYWTDRHVVNLALGGTGSVYSVRASEVVKNYNPSVVYIACGGNNAYRNQVLFYYADIKQMISNIKRDCPTAKIYISKIVSLFLMGVLLDPAVNARIGFLNSMIDTIASENIENVYVIDPKPVMENELGLLQDVYTTDGTHFSQSGYDAMIPFLASKMF